MLFILKNSGNLKNRSGWLRNEIYTRILEACEIAKFDKEKRIQYNKDMIDERRRQGELQAAIRMGREEGIQEGVEKGREVGREEGREEGRKQAIRTMLAAGIPVADVARAFSMTEDECMAL